LADDATGRKKNVKNVHLNIVNVANKFEINYFYCLDQYYRDLKNQY